MFEELFKLGFQLGELNSRIFELCEQMQKYSERNDGPHLDKIDEFEAILAQINFDMEPKNLFYKSKKDT